MKYSALVLLFLSTCALAQLPDAPQPQCADGQFVDQATGFCITTLVPEFKDTSSAALKLVDQKPDHFWNKKFVFATAALFGSEIYDAEVSHAGIQRGRCTEAFGDPHSSRGQLYARMLPIDGVLFGFALFTRKARIPFAPYAPLLVGTGKHIYAGSQWFTWGCM